MTSAGVQQAVARAPSSNEVQTQCAFPILRRKCPQESVAGLCKMTVVCYFMQDTATAG